MIVRVIMLWTEGFGERVEVGNCQSYVPGKVVRYLRSVLEVPTDAWKQAETYASIHLNRDNKSWNFRLEWREGSDADLRPILDVLNCAWTWIESPAGTVKPGTLNSISPVTRIIPIQQGWTAAISRSDWADKGVASVRKGWSRELMRTEGRRHYEHSA